MAHKYKINVRVPMNIRIPRIVLAIICIIIGVALLLPYIFNGYAIIFHQIEFINAGGIFDVYPTSSVSCSYHDYFYDDQYIYYRCSIGVYNHSQKVKTIKIGGLFVFDYLCGYISSPVLECVNSEGLPLEITLEGSQTIQIKDVLFRAKRNQSNDTLKFDRSMPLLFVA